MIELNLNIKPYSVNSYYYGNRSIKRRETVEWEYNILDRLKDNSTQESIKEFTKSFDPSKHHISVDIIFYYPKEKFYTKKGTISSRIFDLSNVEKPLIDVIFLEKYSSSSIKNIEIDDKYITTMNSRKKPAEDYNITIKIEKHDLSDL